MISVTIILLYLPYFAVNCCLLLFPIKLCCRPLLLPFAVALPCCPLLSLVAQCCSLSPNHILSLDLALSLDCTLSPWCSFPQFVPPSLQEAEKVRMFCIIFFPPHSLVLSTCLFQIKFYLVCSAALLFSLHKGNENPRLPPPLKNCLEEIAKASLFLFNFYFSIPLFSHCLFCQISIPSIELPSSLTL